MYTKILPLCFFLFLQATHPFAGCMKIPLIVTKDNGLVYVNRQDMTANRISRFGMPFSVDYIEEEAEKYRLYWSNLNGNGLTSSYLQNEKLTNITSFMQTNGARVEGLSLNWIDKQIYWVLPDAGIIEVANLNGKFRAPLITGLTSPRALAVDPIAGFIFWSDKKRSFSEIQRSRLSGLDIFTLQISSSDDNSINGLTLDYRSQLIYWVEARSETIHKITYDGLNHEEIQMQSHLKCPVGIAIHGNELIWSDQDSGKIIQASNGEENVLYETYSNIYGIRLLEKHINPTIYNRCNLNNGGCSHLCFSNNGIVYCHCSYGYRLAADEKTCQKVTKELDVIFHFEKKMVHATAIFKQDLENPIWPKEPVDFSCKARHVISIDYDYLQDVYYLLDLSTEEILESSNGNLKRVLTVSPDVKAFALDSLKSRIFIAVGGRDPHIASCSIENKHCHPFVNTDVHPTEISLQHQKRNLVWMAESEHMIKIFSLSLNDNTTTIVSEGKDICCLAVDFTTDMLWWIDRERSVVVTQNETVLEGNTVPYSMHFEPISLAVMGGIIYIASTTSIIMNDSSKNISASIYSFKNTGTIAAIKAFNLAKSEVTMDIDGHTSLSYDINTTVTNADVIEEGDNFELSNLKNHTECFHLCIHEGDCVFTSDKHLMCHCPQLAKYLVCTQQFCNCVHGDCAVINDEFACICDSGFIGNFCDVPSCDGRCAFGRCSIFENNTSCSCDPEWGGDRCNEPKMQVSKFCFDWCQEMVNYTEEKGDLCRCYGHEGVMSLRVTSIIIGTVMYMVTVLLLSVIIFLCVITARKKHIQSSLESEQEVSFLSGEKTENNSQNISLAESSVGFFGTLTKLHKKIILFWQLRLPSGHANTPQVLSSESDPSRESEV